MKTIEERYEELLSKADFTTPPPEGVHCECDSGDEHFHVRCMRAECDECGVEVREDFIVYTREEGFAALASHCRKNGWFVLERANYYACPECVTKGRHAY